MGLQAFWHVAESCIRSNPPTLTCHKHCKFGAPESLELSGVPMVPIDVTLVVVVVEGSFLEECLRRGSPLVILVVLLYKRLSTSIGIRINVY